MALLPKTTIAKIDTLLDVSTTMLRSQAELAAQAQSRFGHAESSMRPPSPPMTDEEKQLYDGLLADLGPEVRRQAEELIKTEIRDMMFLGGNWARVKELLKLGKRPKVVRKREGQRDPLFLQFGDGVDEEIEELRILG